MDVPHVEGCGGADTGESEPTGESHLPVEGIPRLPGPALGRQHPERNAATRKGLRQTPSTVAHTLPILQSSEQQARDLAELQAIGMSLSGGLRAELLAFARSKAGRSS